MSIHIAEVGFPHMHGHSLTGIESKSGTEGIQTPRLVIFESGGEYEVHHRNYSKRARAAAAQIYVGNIYQPDTLQDLPEIGLLVLKNVITDPSCAEKIWEGLLVLLDSKIVAGGIVLFIDYILRGTAATLESLKVVIAQNPRFAIVLDQAQHASDQLAKPEVWSSDTDIIQLLLANLEHIAVVDEALRRGLSTLNTSNKQLLVLQARS